MRVSTLVILLVAQVALVLPCTTAVILSNNPTVPTNVSYGLYIGAVFSCILLAICLKLLGKVHDLEAERDS